MRQCSEKRQILALLPWTTVLTGTLRSGLEPPKVTPSQLSYAVRYRVKSNKGNCKGGISGKYFHCEGGGGTAQEGHISVPHESLSKGCVHTAADQTRPFQTAPHSWKV